MKTIYLVDDSPTILMSVSGILEKQGYSVHQFQNAIAALEKLQQGETPDLIITDLHMPGMDGLEFIKAVRGLPACRFRPILFLTTESQQSKRSEARAAGATGWLVKPVAADQLIGVVERILPHA